MCTCSSTHHASTMDFRYFSAKEILLLPKKFLEVHSITSIMTMLQQLKDKTTKVLLNQRKTLLQKQVYLHKFLNFCKMTTKGGVAHAIKKWCKIHSEFVLQ